MVVNNVLTGCFGGVVFDEPTHTYTLRGQVIPSVSSIIRSLYDFSAIPPDVLKAKAALGTAVHVATELDDLGVLDEASVDGPVMPYLSAWRRFVSETGAKVRAIECRMVSPSMHYAGTLDRIVTIDGVDYLLDIKTTVAVDPAVGVQLAAYEMLCMGSGAWESPLRRAVVQVRDDGSYRLHEFNRTDDARCFLGLLAVSKWRSK